MTFASSTLQIWRHEYSGDLNIVIFVAIDRRDDKAIINPHTQSGGIGVQTPIMTYDLIILTFLPLKLGLIGTKQTNF
ncbi:hypothetical protein MTR_8g077140 [Medicago truncatula]|uniref:Uncharacterized protein n=1 Tax=Medicago truncatula TaxID=3880 RepID=A0A072U3N3_MEDTR|nr:hypothetical protein MTR_8g077140 [Medicago truncatula]